MLHGLEKYRIKGEPEILGSLVPKPALMRTLAIGDNTKTPKVMVDPVALPVQRMLAPTFTFCRMFPKGEQPSIEGLITLGLAMETEVGSSDLHGDSTIPAGFTYFGQFVDHDITFDPTQLATIGAADPSSTINNRTPALDLDSVYGGGPGMRPEIYSDDGFSLEIGSTVKSPDESGKELPVFPNDLKRDAESVAVIGDPRNDENLAVAQIHLAITKYHNLIGGQLRKRHPKMAPDRLFAKAHRHVVQQYQRIILTDFLPRVLDVNVLQDVLKNGRKIYTDDLRDSMPVEFSVAAFRMGHSMIRPVYNWNRVFNSGPNKLTESTLQLLFEFSGLSGSRGDGDGPFFDAPSLPSNWIVDWRLMFEIPGNPPSSLGMNRARKIDTQMAFALKMLPEFQKAGETSDFLLSLASRNLLRGRLVSLPSGQQVAKTMTDRGIVVNALSEDVLGSGPLGPIIRDNDFIEHTPLWYYVLREAEQLNGERLGAVGSRIVAETFVGLIENSKISILSDTDIDGGGNIKPFRMADLLLAVGDLNPLGDGQPLSA